MKEEEEEEEEEMVVVVWFGVLGIEPGFLEELTESSYQPWEAITVRLSFVLFPSDRATVLLETGSSTSCRRNKNVS